MPAPMTLIEFLLNLLRDPAARAEFLADGDSFLAECQSSGYDADDVHDALVLLRDNTDFSREHHTGHNSVSVATPPPVHHVEHETPQAAVEYLNTYITQNYVDDRDTIVDNSVNQQIDTGGGDFDQDIDIDSAVASGDGSVAAGGDITDSTLVTGEGNLVGEGNVVGDGNVGGEGNSAVTGAGGTVAFGEGAATTTEMGDVEVGDGGAFAGGDAAVDNSDNSLEDVGNDDSDNSLDNVGNDNSEETAENVGNDNSDNSTDDDVDIDGSGNIGVSLELAAL